MRTYGQYCPIARAAEILAERWTPIIVRNMTAGCRTYGEISAGAPGLSHSLLTQRLRQLAAAGVVEVRPKDHGRGNVGPLAPRTVGLVRGRLAPDRSDITGPRPLAEPLPTWNHRHRR